MVWKYYNTYILKEKKWDKFSSYSVRFDIDTLPLEAEYVLPGRFMTIHRSAGKSQVERTISLMFTA